ncbi:hypothetical protein THIARS_80020 [Thiomonas delicata]|uniref:Uncharacterized protein n=1 Tax=Thiomonas delicata TaxID=364030 RepID=A0A238D857_THIDL|nr:hypothetical protein THIARS_80020 [Thiomonas delicata]
MADFSSLSFRSVAPEVVVVAAVLSRRAEFEIETISPPACVPTAPAATDPAVPAGLRLVLVSTFWMLPLAGFVTEFWMGFIADILLITQLTTQIPQT